ncbi:MAG: metallophosphoesterase family protein, partial [Fidelibacterota bacterium]
MKIAILSDIHGNYEALKSALLECEQEKVDKIYNLGDFINYGPQSEEVIREIIKRKIPSILGNHEYALLNENFLDHFQVHAQLSFFITQSMISKKSYQFINSLPTHIQEHKLYFVHGTPPDNLFDYVYALSDYQFNEIFNAMDAKLFFVGHTHQCAVYKKSKNKIEKLPLFPEEPVKIEQTDKAIVNVGSVGQPRGSNKNAHFVIYDS